MSTSLPQSSSTVDHHHTPQGQPADTHATSTHPPSTQPDPTTTTSTTATHDAASQGRDPTTSSPGSAELARLKVTLRANLRQFRDFPTPGILFEDIMPLFARPDLHSALIRALELQLAAIADQSSGGSKIDVLVGLESRGFLFAPTLALRLGAAFVPVRKRGKLPGPCASESFRKEYGVDEFEMQSDALRPGQRVVVMDDIIATGGSAGAAERLVRKLGGVLVGFVFLMELDFLKGRDGLGAPVWTLLTGQEEGSATAEVVEG